MKIIFNTLVLGVFSTYLQASEISFGEPKIVELPGQTKLEASSFADIDGDGKIDMLSGNYAGNLIMRKNVSTGAEMKFAAPKKLQRAGQDIALTHW